MTGAVSAQKPWTRVRGLLLLCAAWFALWCLTPGLLEDDPVRWIIHDDAVVLLVESLLVLLLAIVLLRAQRGVVAPLLGRSRWSVAWVLPAALLVVLPFHYGQSLPPALYVFWIGVSVLWQDCLTFGLLQSHLAKRLGPVAAVPIVAVLFLLGHALLLPERFGPAEVVPGLLILGLGAALASLRAATRTLHLVLALHLSFYLVVV